MKPTPKLENEIHQIYDIWLHSYLNGDVDTYAEYFDTNYRFIGSTGNEEFLDKKETKTFFENTADQLAGKCDLRNETRIIEKFEALVFITHLFDAWFKNGDDWTYYGRFRFTNALKKNNEGWRFIYQHFSTTDSKTDEGETIGFDKVRAENLDLKDAIKRHTHELEEKNRELLVEGALEKVRSRTMAMQHSDELQETSFLLDQQVRALGIKTWGCAFNIYGKKESTEWFGNEAGVLHTYTVPHEGIFKEYFQKGQKGESLFIKEFSGEACIAHYEYMSSLPVIGDVLKILKKTNNGFPTYQIDHVVYFRYGYLLFITREHVPDAHDIFKRFAKVFEQTYTRFLDLQKAEVQAREAQIEAALEKVRSRSLAMHKSNELNEVILEIHNKFKDLDISMESRVAVIAIFEKDSKDFKQYIASHDVSNMRISTPYFKHPVLDDFATAKKEGVDFYSKAYSLEQKNSYFNTLFETSNFGKIEGIEEQRKWTLEQKFYIYSPAFQKNSSVGIADFSGIPLNDTEIAIIKRFSKVFEQAYIRFLDLQKAEAQAREAQIEMALEKVRSRTMAMHNSEELKEVIQVLYNQFVQLGIPIEHAGFILDYKENDNMHIWLADQHAVFPEIILPYFDCAHWNSFKEAKKKGEDFFSNQLDFEEKNKFYKDLFEFITDIPEDTKKTYFEFDGLAISTVLLDTIGLYIENFSGIPFSDDENVLLMRFGKVFQQTYTRFLDLKKAEAQAREAKIEVALEKVRSRSIGMQRSHELAQVVQLLDEELIGLGIQVDGTQILTDFDNPEKNISVWFGMKGQDYLEKFNAPYFNHPIRKKFHNALTKGVDFYTEQYSKTDKNKFFKLLFNNSDFGRITEERKKFIYDSPGLTRASVLFKNSIFIFQRYRLLEFSEEENEVFKRFAKVFEQAYTRFLDLKKAEAQAREAQIEAALERVRSRSMAMHNSDELREAGALLFNEITKLGIESLTSGYVIMDEDEKIGWNYMPDPSTGQIIPTAVGVFHDMTDNMRAVTKNWKKQNPVFVIDMDEKQTIAHQTFIAEESLNFPISAEKLIAVSPAQLKLHTFNFKQGYLLIVGGRLLTDDQIEIMLRFTKVFQQTYTRFLDLEKAEAQAREAQIENALEKVRSRTMAMQHSDELPEAANVLFTEVQNLGIPAWSCGYNILSEDKKSSTCIMSSEGEIQSPFILPLTEHESLKPWHKAIVDDKEFFVYEQGENDLVAHYDYMQSLPDLKETFQQLKDAEIPLPTFQVNHLAKFTNGFLLFITYESVPEAHDIFKRFGKVFEQTYTRFLDLKKAESQARESQIEAALERVRSKAMSMRSSEDIGEATTILFKEIEKLEIETMRCGILIIHKNKVMDVWTTSTAKDDKIIRVTGQIDMTIHPLFESVYKSWTEQKAITEYELSGKDGERYYEAITKGVNYKLPATSVPKDRHYNTWSTFNEGALFAFTKDKVPADARLILQRFAKVFGLTYQRYRELIESEKREKEAKKQSSLNRVRGEIASMRSTEDLNRITPIIWQELTNLGVPFFRCGVFIMVEEKEDIQVHLSDPNGKSLGLMNLDYTTSDLTKNSVAAWRKNSVFKAHWNKKEFIEWTKSLIDLGKVKTKKGYQGGDDAPESLDLHFVPFSQGMLYVGNLKPLTEDQIGLVKNLAESFSIAYARYEDFVKLEKAKESIESTLTELQTTQTQLIQSEKMASLGELTAGIAHEIQNPLNFVNNFSEVSKELLEEMLVEMENGAMEEVKAIMDDVVQNLEKINHHGKRADGIVKGMLQHSRTSSGTKELTDINALADEYLRLAYHGLRAKNKSFNAEMMTDFNKNVGKVQVIPQDMGRVILNLITNAFYAVNEKKQQDEHFKPSVSVSTKKTKEHVEIKVTDNGNGIPPQVIDKIFQPFFTTKPTGEGTGLGLSMSYDIITKGHGGRLKVESKEGKGTTFYIILQLTK